ncbi:MAG: class I SAM-dependent methyltransferase [Bacteroidota bacterium]
MKEIKHLKVERTLEKLLSDARNDYLRISQGLMRSFFRPAQPSDFKNAYLSISSQQGKELEQLIIENEVRNVVEFGTSFGISTLYLAHGIIETEGKIITTELLSSKAKKARENFEDADVSDLIELKVGDALETLKDHEESIDLLVLDGWKNLYLPLFQLLKPNFHENTLIYVDNADMAEASAFLAIVKQMNQYDIEERNEGKVAVLRCKDHSE